MSEHPTEWLNAFLDGELHGLHLRQVLDHLARCAACREELEDLRSLSQMLKEAASSETNKSPDRFIEELIRMLPPREYPFAHWKGNH